MKQILIIGAGFAGLWSALSAIRQLDLNGSKEVEVTLLAPRPNCMCARASTSPTFTPWPRRCRTCLMPSTFASCKARHSKLMKRPAGSATVPAAAPSAPCPTTALSWPAAVLLNRPDMVGIEHVFDVDKIDSAARLETHLKSLASLPDTPARNTVVVAGGGFTGIETATELPARLREILGEDAALRVVVIDRGARMGAALGDGIRPAIEQACAALGVEWVCGATVASVDPAGVLLDNGQRIDASTVVWTVGFKANPLTEQISGERDRLGRLHVDGNLKVKGNDAVYAAGDVAYAACDELGNHAVMSCQHAIPLGRYAGNNAAAELIGVAPVTYSQPKYVTCLDLGAWGAVYTEGWERTVSPPEDKAEAKALKAQINTVWIYPPAADRAAALAAADPTIPVA